MDFLFNTNTYIYIVDKFETRPFDKNKSRRKRPRGVLGPFTVIFTRRVQPAESRSQPFPLSRKSSRPSGVFALFSTTNHGWLLISKLGEENSRKLLSRIVFSFFFLLIKRRELSLRSRESLSRVIFHEWTLWINYPRIFFDFRCSLLCKNNSREFYFSRYRLGENNIFENRFWDLPSKNLSVRKI